jgi:hypothetical protein
MEKKYERSKGKMCLLGESHHFAQKCWMSGVQEFYALLGCYLGQAKGALISLLCCQLSCLT